MARPVVSPKPKPIDPVACLLAGASAEVVAAWLIVAAADYREPTATAMAALTSARHAALAGPGGTALTWWHAASTGTGLRAATAALRRAVDLPADVSGALTAIAAFKDAPLAQYRSRVVAERAFEAASRAIRKKQREYPSITGIADAIGRRDRAGVTAKMRELGHDTAGWRHAHTEITNAMSAFDAAPDACNCPTAALPASWLENPDLAVVAGMLVGIFRDRDRSRIAAAIEGRLLASVRLLAPAERDAVKKWLGSAGALALTV